MLTKIKMESKIISLIELWKRGFYLNHFYYLHMPIEVLFFENGRNRSVFSLFRTYCGKQGIMNAGRLNEQIIREFVDSCSELKSNDRKEKAAQQLFNRLQRVKISTSDSVLLSDTSLYPFIHPYSFHDILIAAHLISPNQAKPTEMITVSDMDGLTNINVLQRLNSHYDLMIISEILSLLYHLKSPTNIVDQALQSFDEREIDILKGRSNRQMTLDDLGKKYQLERERVRQIYEKSLEQFFLELKIEQFDLVLKIIFANRNAFRVNDVKDLLPESLHFAVDILKHESLPLRKNNLLSLHAVYDEVLQVFFLDRTDYERTKPLREYLFQLPALFHPDEINDEFTNHFELSCFPMPSASEQEEILKLFHYEKTGEVFRKPHVSLVNQIEYLFKRHISSPLKLNAQGIEKIKNLSKIYLGEEITGDHRAIDGLIRRCNHVLLVDRNTFAWCEPNQFDLLLLERIKLEIDHKLNENDVVSAERMYQMFADELEQNEILNKYHLYSLIQTVYEGEFNSRGNTLSFYKGKQVVDREEALYRFLKQNGGLASNDQTMEKLGWKEFKLFDVVSKSRKIINWGTRQIKLVESLQMTTEIREWLSNLLQNIIENGVVPVSKMLSEMAFDQPQTYENWRDTHGIHEVIRLAGILKVTFDLNGHSQLLFEKTSPIQSVEQFVASHFQHEVTREEIKDFLMSYGYREVSALNILTNLVTRDLFIEMSTKTLIPKASYSFNEGLLQELPVFIEKLVGQSEYLALEYTRHHYVFSYDWRDFLDKHQQPEFNIFDLKQYLLKHGWKQVTMKGFDLRHDEILMLPADSTLLSYDLLVYHVIKNEYDEINMYQANVMNFLLKKHLLKRQLAVSVEANLPEALTDSPLFQIDILGNISLIEHDVTNSDRE
jgi:hypothetical protein